MLFCWCAIKGVKGGMERQMETEKYSFKIEVDVHPNNTFQYNSNHEYMA